MNNYYKTVQLLEGKGSALLAALASIIDVPSYFMDFFKKNPVGAIRKRNQSVIQVAKKVSSLGPFNYTESQLAYLGRRLINSNALYHAAILFDNRLFNKYTLGYTFHRGGSYMPDFNEIKRVTKQLSSIKSGQELSKVLIDVTKRIDTLTTRYERSDAESKKKQGLVNTLRGLTQVLRVTKFMVGLAK